MIVVKTNNKKFSVLSDDKRFIINIGLLIGNVTEVSYEDIKGNVLTYGGVYGTNYLKDYKVLTDPIRKFKTIGKFLNMNAGSIK